VFCQLIHTLPDRLLQDEAELPKLPPFFFFTVLVDKFTLSIDFPPVLG